MQACNNDIHLLQMRRTDALVWLLGGLMLLTVGGCSTPGRSLSGDTAGRSPSSQQTGLSRQEIRDADAQFERALAALQARQHDEAQALFRALSEAHPELSGPLTNLGILDAQGRDVAQALRHFSRAVEANPDNAVAFNWLGILQREQGAHAQAEQAYLSAIALDDGYASAHRNLGVLYDVYLQRPAAAVTHYRRYLELEGGKDLIVLAWIHELEDRDVTTAAVSPGQAP